MEAIPVIRIALDPGLTQHYGAEIHWVWRLLLTTCGWGWQEVTLGEPCDIAWVCKPQDALSARLVILANPCAWPQPSRHRLANVAHVNSVSFPVYQGEHEPHPVEAWQNGQIVCLRDLIFDVYWLATGQEERHYPRERHGFYLLENTLYYQEHLPLLALASQIAHWLEKTLRGLGYPEPLPRWPSGKRAAVAVGHDVDYPEVLRFLEPLRKVTRWGVKGVRPALEVVRGHRSHWHFADWVTLERSLELRSAFYFVARKGSLFRYAWGVPDPFYDITTQKFRQLFQFLQSEGFEIGLQASYLAFQDIKQFEREKALLEEMSRAPVRGNRHHYWHLNPQLPEDTLWMHEKLGFEYDSSLIHDHYLGWRRGLSHPFFPFHPGLRRQLRTLQIPPAWMDDQLFTFGRYNRIRPEPLETLKIIADRVAEQGGCLSLDVHEYVYDEQLFPGWRETYRGLLIYLKDRGDFWFETPLMISCHWRNRYCQIRSISYGLDQGQM